MYFVFTYKCNPYLHYNYKIFNTFIRLSVFHFGIYLVTVNVIAGKQYNQSLNYFYLAVPDTGSIMPQSEQFSR